MKRENLLDCHGMSYKCKINDTNIDDGKICVERNRVYLCQNKKNGSKPEDALGFEYGWIVGSGSDEELKSDNVTDFELIKERQYFPIDTYFKFRE
jgi:hypothetical protein